MSIVEKAEAIIKDFSLCEDWEKKYEKIIAYGKNYAGLQESERIDDLKVKGCQSQVWIKSTLSPEGKVVFYGDSDALLVKGLVALVVQVYSNETPEMILQYEPEFLRIIGLDKGLSPSRSNGLFSMIKQIKYYATAYQYMLKMKNN